VEAEDAAETALGFGNQQWRWIRRLVRGLNVGEEGGEVVVEGEDAGVSRIVSAVGADVGGTEITVGIVGEAGADGLLCGLALPGALGALGGDENPLAEKRIVAAVGDEIEGAGRGGHGSPLRWRSDGYKCKRERETGASSGVHPTHR
jgi:hypothetical protein